MKRRAQRMARPRPTPLPEGSTQNMAIEEIRLKSSEPVQTGHQQKQGKKQRCWRMSSTAAVFVALLQTCGPQPPLPQRKMLLVRMWLMQYHAIYWFTLPTAGFNAGSVRCPCVKTQGSKRFGLCLGRRWERKWNIILNIFTIPHL